MTAAGGTAPNAYTTVVEDLARHCAITGLDLVRPLQAGWYNSTVSDRHRIVDFGDPGSLVVLIGNTRQLWTRLLATLPTRRDLLADANPLDAFVEQSIGAVTRTLQLDSCIRWAHRPQPHHIAIQQMAEVAGLAWRSPASLSIHPDYGPWIGLRAAIVFPIPGPAERPLPAPACVSCDAACMQVHNDRRPDNGSWQHQLAIRDACPIGRRHRYSDLQIAYHYSKSRESLHQAISQTENTDA